MIELLERNGRMPFLELAEHTGLSPSTVRDRVIHLIASTALRVGAVVKRRGWWPELFARQSASIWAHGTTTQYGNRVAARNRIPRRTLGRYDVIATVAANSSSDLHALSERIRGIDSVGG